MRKALLTLTLMVFLTIPFSPVFASSICEGSSTCQASEVGVFMEGITTTCGNYGNCTLEDIMLVFSNVGNWVLGIVGSLVFIMYIIGGYYFLVSQGGNLKQKGIKMIRTSTVGLLIVFGAYIGMQTLFLTLHSGGTVATGEYIVCTPDESLEGKSCNLYSKCYSGVCVSDCERKNTEEQDPNTYACLDTDAAENKGYSCSQGFCPGDESVRCCVVATTTTE
jgi:hypothetical protein